MPYTTSLHGALGNGDLAVHRYTAWGSGQCMGQWAVGLLKYTSSVHEVVGSRDPAAHCLTAWVSGWWGSFNTPPHCMGQLHYFMSCGGEHWGSFCMLPHCTGQRAVGIPHYSAS